MSDMKTDAPTISSIEAWQPFAGFEGLYYNLVEVDHDRRVVDMLMKFDPNARCIPHRHTGPTRTIVIEGEHQIFETDDNQFENPDRRPVGTVSANDGDETHFEGGGEDGAVILLTMTEADEAIYELFDDDLNLTRTITIADFQRGFERQQAASD